MPPRPPEGRAAGRDRLIVLLIAEGLTVVELAHLTGLSAQHIRRIRRAGGGPAPPPPLTGLELRGLRREMRASPAALDWLATARPDRRHDGRPMV